MIYFYIAKTLYMKYIIFTFFFLFIVNNVDASIRRVGFTDVPPVPGVDYTTFYLAHQAAVNGDTILVWPGKILVSADWPTASNRPEILKRLIIIGKGYWLDSTSVPKGNSGLQTGTGSPSLGTSEIIFLVGSEGSVLMGFNINGRVNISTNNITLKRNWAMTVYLGNTNSSNVLIEGNYRLVFDGISNASQVWSNIIIRNNFIYRMWSMPLKSYSGIITNNTFAYDQTLNTTLNGGDLALSENVFANSFSNDISLHGGTWLFENNILIVLSNLSGSLNGQYQFLGLENTTFNHNVQLQGSVTNSWPPSGVGNVVLSPTQAVDIFEAFPAIGTSSADGRYRLKVNSPAKAGSVVRPTATVDAGMYGGPTPYKLGMIPSIPTIYSISSPQGNTPTGSTIQINISTRSNN
jgi:hypothetical protein